MPPLGGYGVGKAASLTRILTCICDWSSPDCCSTR